MIVQEPPFQINENLMVLGISQYPLYLVEGESEAALIEGGVGAMGPVLERQLAQLSLPVGYVKQAAVTHAHPDHVMAVPMLRKLFPGISIAASKIAADTLAAEKAIGFFAKIDRAFTESLIQNKAIGEEHRPAPLAENQIPIDRIVAEGDTLEVAPLSLAVLETPGHSDCSLSFHEASTGLLLISDATGYFMPEAECWWPNYFTGYGAYVDSMRRLAALNAEVLCLSHNAVIQGADAIAEYFRGAIAATENYHERIIAEFQANESPRDIAGRLGAEVFEKAKMLNVEFFQKNCGLLVKQSLKYEGLEEKKEEQ